MKRQKSSRLKPRTLRDILDVLNSLRDVVRERYHAEIVGVFGSYARGEARSRSDVDVLVHFLEGASLFDLVGLADFLEKKLGRKVDIVSDRAIRPELREQIMKDLVRI